MNDNGLSLLSLNIDGFRSNFDCFLVHHEFNNINQKLELCYSTVDFEELCVQITVKSEK